MGLARWYWKHNSFWNDADRRRRRARQAEKRRAAAAKQKAANQANLRHNVDAGIREYLAQNNRTGLTAQEVRDIEFQLRATSMSNAEIAERMRAVRLWRKPSKRSASSQPRRVATAGIFGAIATGGTFGAIAFSPQTYAYGYSYGARDQQEAERVAPAHCRAKDARIVAWTDGGWVALAAGAGRWGAHLGTSQAEAEQKALAAGGYAGLSIVVSYAAPIGP
jgi:hypothetical protein